MFVVNPPYPNGAFSADDAAKLMKISQTAKPPPKIVAHTHNFPHRDIHGISATGQDNDDCDFRGNKWGMPAGMPHLYRSNVG